MLIAILLVIGALFVTGKLKFDNSSNNNEITNDSNGVSENDAVEYMAYRVNILQTKMPIEHTFKNIICFFVCLVY